MEILPAINLVLEFSDRSSITTGKSLLLLLIKFKFIPFCRGGATTFHFDAKNWATGYCSALSTRSRAVIVSGGWQINLFFPGFWAGGGHGLGVRALANIIVTGEIIFLLETEQTGELHNQ